MIEARAEWKYPSRFFDQADYSDITIRFSGREIKAHKLFLCDRSKYFRKALGPSSAWMESGTGILTLEEDDPDAVEAMLRYLYGFRYPCDFTTSERGWAHHLDVMVVADKYGLKNLGQAAFIELKDCARGLKEPSSLIDLICESLEIAGGDGELKTFIDDLCDRNFVNLFPIEEFQQILDQDEALKEKLYEKHFVAMRDRSDFRAAVEKDGKLAFRLLTRWSWSQEFEEKKMFRCPFCFEMYVKDRHETTANCGWCRYHGSQGCRGNLSQLSDPKPCWVERRPPN